MSSRRNWLYEFIGTTLHVFAGTFAVALGFAPASPLVSAVPNVMTRRLLVGLLFVGSAILVAVSPLGRRSGGHLNPAISVGFWLHGRLPRRDTVAYVVAQCAGALVAAATAAAIAPGLVRDVGYAVTRPGAGISPLGATSIEAAETALLLTVIFTLVSSHRLMRFTPLVVWLLISSYVWLLAPLTGASVNPARSLGPAVVGGSLGGYWPYAVGPIAGAALVGLAWRVSRLKPALSPTLCGHPSAAASTTAAVASSRASASSGPTSCRLAGTGPPIRPTG